MLIYLLTKWNLAKDKIRNYILVILNCNLAGFKDNEVFSVGLQSG